MCEQKKALWYFKILSYFIIIIIIVLVLLVFASCRLMDESLMGFPYLQLSLFPHEITELEMKVPAFDCIL